MRMKRFRGEGWALLGMIWALAWPTMLEQLMSTAVQYVDAAMVGRLGAQATAAVGATTTVSWLIGSTVSALGIGFLSFIAQAYGADDRARAARTSSQAVLAVLFSGTLFTVIPLLLSRRVPVWMHAAPEIQQVASQYFAILYMPMLARAASTIFGTALRATGDSKTPMRAGLAMNLVNVVLNFLLIYESRTVRALGLSIWLPGAGMGVIGAAIASAVSYAVGGVWITCALWKHPVISPRGQRLRPDWDVLRPCLKVALPSALQRFGTSFGYVAFASMINALGTIPLAAHSIANTVESAFYIPGYGMQTAAATLIGNALGARDERLMRRLARMLVGIEMVLMVVSGGLLFIFAPGMMSLFTIDAAVIALGRDGAAHGGGVRAVLRRRHHPGGHAAGNGQHDGALCVQYHRHVGRAHPGHVCLHAPAAYGAGGGLGVHDRAQPAAVPAAADLLPARQVEPADPRITRRTAGKLQM